MKFLTVTQYQVRMTLMTFQGHGCKGQGQAATAIEMCNSMAPELLKGFEPAVPEVGSDDRL